VSLLHRGNEAKLAVRSVPYDYEDLLSYYTKRGYRVIAIAGKSIETLSWLKAQRMKRSVSQLLRRT
jgi:hypothetical protein